MVVSTAFESRPVPQVIRTTAIELERESPVVALAACSNFQIRDILHLYVELQAAGGS